MENTDQRLLFSIDVFKPETLPSNRLAKYLSELSKLLGQSEHVHLLSVDKGSAVLNHFVSKEAKPKIIKRLKSIGESPDVTKSFDRLNKLLKEDGDEAMLFGMESLSIQFPGKAVDEEVVLTLPFEEVLIRGELLKIGGTDNTVPLEIRDSSSGRIVKGSTINREIAKELGANLFSQVELSGIGQWIETSSEGWKLFGYKVNSFRTLKDSTFKEVIETVKSLPSISDHDPQEIIKDLRKDV